MTEGSIVKRLILSAVSKALPPAIILQSLNEKYIKVANAKDKLSLCVISCKLQTQLSTVEDGCIENHFRPCFGHTVRCVMPF